MFGSLCVFESLTCCLVSCLHDLLFGPWAGALYTYPPSKTRMVCSQARNVQIRLFYIAFTFTDTAVVFVGVQAQA